MYFNLLKCRAPVGNSITCNAKRFYPTKIKFFIPILIKSTNFLFYVYRTFPENINVHTCPMFSTVPSFGDQRFKDAIFYTPLHSFTAALFAAKLTN